MAYVLPNTSPLDDQDDTNRHHTSVTTLIPCSAKHKSEQLLGLVSGGSLDRQMSLSLFLHPPITLDGEPKGLANSGPVRREFMFSASTSCRD